MIFNQFIYLNFLLSSDLASVFVLHLLIFTTKIAIILILLFPILSGKHQKQCPGRCI